MLKKSSNLGSEEKIGLVQRNSHYTTVLKANIRRESLESSKRKMTHHRDAMIKLMVSSY